VRILLTGCNGQVGWELGRSLATLGELVALGRDGLDLCDEASIRRATRAAAPNVIVNAAAYTTVDRAEAEPELAHAVNGVAPGILAEEARRCDALLVHYSTDYVFDGEKGTPYREDDAPNPVSAYGRSKLEGERAIQRSGCRHLILRTCWVYAARGNNFVRTILRLARERGELSVVGDQTGSPTSAHEIAAATASLLARGAPADGIYHLSAAGETTWYEFALAILSLTGPEHVKVRRITTAEYPTAARRPRYSVLSNEKVRNATGIALADWRTPLEAVCRALR
jgi:dTDP-4-dehydrorhamnose reductase